VSTTSRSNEGEAASTRSAEWRRPDDNRALTSSAETHLMNSAAIVADVAH
jgi:hypothetical protein